MTTTAIVTILTLLVAQATPARRSTLLVYVSIGEYYGTVYVPPPSGFADHVLLRGQPLIARLTIVNEGAEQGVRLRPSQFVPFKVHVAATASPQPLAQGVVSRSAVLRIGGREEKGALPAMLKPAESLQWDATVPDFQKLPAGLYRVKAEPQV